MAENQDLQKEYADDQGGGNGERFEVGDLVLLNAKNLPTHAVSVVFKTKLRPTFIEPFKVVAKKGLACTLNLPKKMRTHPVFYVGLLKLYRDLAQVSAEGLTPGRHVVAEPREAGQQQAAGPQVAGRTAEDATTRLVDRAAGRLDAPGLRPGSDSLEEAGRLAAPSSQPGCEPLAGTQPSPPAAAFHRDLPPGGERRRSRRGRTRRQGEDAIPEGARRCDSRREYPAEARPPTTLLDERNDPHYHVERLVARRRRQGRIQYLVKWIDYPH
ncbi:hypothetical protein PC129_g22115 [Phytophthora cactorum]|uniref:Chromo domain-containing protein n=1 Tax=Phytophthora cactorum TaxID=29920 RepID=A0A8T1H3Y4_9STRA|nr:hypothetical protein Pcac1_g26255 [Phytophthora cactorum]KAG2812463.1 hypothetical protein PC111_g14802 [Phytophthora cactorum]KAG2890870.1 hypothetical protein PC114_g17266 [Phytophthora cactorum]KAG2972562.1 hypothetical protein PC118_g15633 [Phytophthora cactorum]KAG3001724.1 hypothetical protein PC119_g16622 [Phytophthora cactorum]